MRLKRMTLVIAVCAMVGALAGIAGTMAAPSKSSKAQAQKQAAKKKAKALRHAFRRGPGGPGFFMFGPVHAEAVVPNADGTGFDKVTTDSGVLKSVDGNTLHIKEGTDKATYKDDVAITVGSDVKVIRNRQDAKLSDLKDGDHVRVITGAPKGDIVIAVDKAFMAQEKKQHDEHGFRHHGFGPGGPPPGDMGPGGMAPGAFPGGQGGSSGQNS